MSHPFVVVLGIVFVVWLFGEWIEWTARRHYRQAVKEIEAEDYALTRPPQVFRKKPVVLFNPYTGSPRHPEDIASDPQGILIKDPGQPWYAHHDDRNRD